MFDVSTLRAFAPAAVKFHDGLQRAAVDAALCTPARMAMFMAQVAHESGGFVYVKELASGAAYDTGRLAARLGNTPEADGDGQKYKGRGLIQCTGRRNYLACSFALFGDERLLAQPELLEEPTNAARSAAWYWSANRLNRFCDRGDFEGLTRAINGGLNGWEDRKKWLLKATPIFV